MTRLNSHAILLLSLAAALSAPAATIVLQDATFSNADWTTTVLSQTGSLTGAGAQSLSGGNPGAYRRQTFSWSQIPSPSSHSIVIASFGPLVFDPSTTGGIFSILIEYDLARIAGSANFTDTGGYRPYLLQDGNIYFLSTSGQNLANSTNWTSHSHLSTASTDWIAVTGFGSGNPDFSASGSPITFGYRTFLVLNCPSGFSFCFADSVASGLDNFKVTITTDDTNSDVPEPSTPVLVLLGITLTAFHRRTSQRR